ncbi:MAG: Unknown protein [uncultured Sulfurovum sp.]|uniref:Uncharacterized protein n=1 Tax=uncultured Sulfurovum sp. TaxID=269237 RepID=A0A6S6S6F8_9BACT|nr:MAG: Unknown protein [uncultured Sulfurovum sp.]
MSNKKKELAVALARKVAHLEVPDEVVERAVAKMAVGKEKIRGVDICTHGICLDYIIEGDTPWKILESVVTLDGIPTRGVKVFPMGIIDPDFLHVQVQHEIPELAGYIKQRP